MQPSLQPHGRSRRTLDPRRAIQLASLDHGRVEQTLGVSAAASIERLLGVSELNAVNDRAANAIERPEGVEGSLAYVRRVLSDMDVRIDVPPEDLARIPKKGPFIAVANHPFGVLDGLVIGAVLGTVRPDLKVMANRMLAGVPALRDLLLLVDPFRGPAAAKSNASPMRESLRWLRDGHALAAFPAGEVAHLRPANLLHRHARADAGEGIVTDPAWNLTIARLARRAEVPVLPVFFDGRNGALFQSLGLVHPILRTILLARSFLAKRGTTVTLRIGSVIPAKRLAEMDNEQEATDYLRRRTFLLRHGVPRPSVALPSVSRPEAAAAATASHSAPSQPSRPSLTRRFVVGVSSACRSFFAAGSPAAETIIPPVDPAQLTAEIAALPPEALLLEHDGMAVYHARAGQIRATLREIGRLREVTFRRVGEGTGKACDLDTFDYDYGHLFIWNRAASEIVGAYRLGQTDALLPAKGRQGLYTSTLFNYREALLQQLNPALEMGRSFVRPEHQRSFAPLLLLWKGIGHYIVRNPRYRYLIGPVSISNSYSTVSRELLVAFLKLHHALPDGDSLARPRNPLKPGRTIRLAPSPAEQPADGLRRLLRDDDDVSALISDLEPDQKGIPVLIRQYLKLGAKFLAFNVDRDFGNCLDGLIVVDLLKTESRVLERYMTKAGYASFVAHHASAFRSTAQRVAPPQSVQPAMQTI